MIRYLDSFCGVQQDMIVCFLLTLLIRFKFVELHGSSITYKQ